MTFVSSLSIFLSNHNLLPPDSSSSVKRDGPASLTQQDSYCIALHCPFICFKRTFFQILEGTFCYTNSPLDFNAIFYVRLKHFPGFFNFCYCLILTSQTRSSTFAILAYKNACCLLTTDEQSFLPAFLYYHAQDFFFHYLPSTRRKNWFALDHRS